VKLWRTLVGVLFDSVKMRLDNSITI